MRTNDENLQAMGDYARYKMMQTKITTIGTILVLVGLYCLIRFH
ncbi:hypothetical protein [Bradyrhizobium phage BDU-MI-1]|nr:hypothetical protein [Bradyrhizobium phage BDU-MI-1]